MARDEDFQGEHSPFFLQALEEPEAVAAAPAAWAKLAPMLSALSPAAKKLVERALVRDSFDRGVRDRRSLARGVLALRRAQTPGRRWSEAAEERELELTDAEVVAPEFGEPEEEELEGSACAGELELEEKFAEELDEEDESPFLEEEESPRPIGTVIRDTGEQVYAVALAKSGTRDPNKITNELFWRRHPDLQGQSLKGASAELKREWKDIYKTRAMPALLSGPAIGPIIDGKDASSNPDYRKDVPKGAVISELAIVQRGLHSTTHKRSKVSQIVVHTTSRGGAQLAIDSGYKKSAVSFVVKHYLASYAKGWAHYVIDFNGVIYGIADETYQTPHSGWSVSRDYLKNKWVAPKWWSDVWYPKGIKNPMSLAKGKGPNTESIGIELMLLPGPLDTKSYTDLQYRALAKLIVDIDKRHNIGITEAPSKELLGHEDFAPYSYAKLKGREDQHGGWDPGAHRDPAHVMFSWSRLWDQIELERKP